MREQNKTLWFGQVLLVSAFLFLALRCATHNDVLTPIDSTSSEPMKDAESVDSPGYKALSQTLQPLGYEGVGLQFENATTLTLLTKVFADPRTHNKQITFLYTGAAHAYDPTYKSLTIGAFTDAEQLIKYIEKNVPKR